MKLFPFEKGFLEVMYETLPMGRDVGRDNFPSPRFSK